MKKTFKILTVFLCLLLVASMVLTSCGKDDTNTEDTTTTAVDNSPNYSELNLEDYIELGNYKGIVVDARETEQDQALWEAIVSLCKVKDYPAEALEYYTNQIVKSYEEAADRAKMTYDELMTALDKDAEDIDREAKDLVKKDLITQAIVKAEGYELTDAEKTELFDKYASYYVDLYGYTEEYIRENLSEEIYDSMQHDKMMEYLIIENYFVAED